METSNMELDFLLNDAEMSESNFLQNAQYLLVIRQVIKDAEMKLRVFEFIDEIFVELNNVYEEYGRIRDPFLDYELILVTRELIAQKEELNTLMHIAQSCVAE
ncbi:hypothetical protein NPIL_208581, partial [Nephila pilipes]